MFLLGGRIGAGVGRHNAQVVLTDG